VPSPGDYLELTPAQARAQWRSILARSPRPDIPGFRQVPFTPVETLLCLAAMAVVDHHHYGGSTNHLSPSPIPELATLFQRTRASILAKQANLDGSRANGARHEIETAQVLLADTDRLAATYLVIVAAARSEGVVPTQLPDFLHLETPGRRLELVGQEELADDELEAAAQTRLARLAGQMGDIPEVITERLLVAAARIGQHRFASQVLENFAHRCGFCGMRPGPDLERKGLLVASHVKPWRESTNRERLDPTNGIAACPNHDSAFDRGLLWVNGGYRIHHSDALASAMAGDPGVTASFGRPPVAEQLVLPDGAVPPGQKFLDWHRTHLAA
jgi:putative restriction endonuclease